MAAKPAALGWRRAIEPWFFGYALLGLSAGGLAPILLPLGAAETGNAAHVGLVMAAVSSGGLTAAVWGGVADRYRCPRLIYQLGAAAVVLALAGLALTNNAAAWFALALVLGVGVAAVNTVANLFVVESYPRDEWATRVGWQQTCYWGGVVIGLGVAGQLSRVSVELGIQSAAACALAGLVLTGVLARRGRVGGGPVRLQ